MAEPIELLNFKTVHRRNVVAVIDVQVVNLFILRGLEIHQKGGFHFVRMPRTVGWRTRKIASRFNIAVLTAIAVAHPEFFKNGRALAPLFESAQKG